MKSDEDKRFTNAWNELYKKNIFNLKDPVQYITAKQIKDNTSIKAEARLMASIFKTKETMPKIFRENGFFILPVKNGIYAIIKGDGNHDIEEIKSEPIIFKSKTEFPLKGKDYGNSEMQHLDFAFSSGCIEDFVNKGKLYLVTRGRKYTPKFSFKVKSKQNEHEIEVESVQIEVDAGYEGKNIIVLVEAKSPKDKNFIIRQLYYPFRVWSKITGKGVTPIFFNHSDHVYSFWQYTFTDREDYNSIKLLKSAKYKIE